MSLKSTSLDSKVSNPNALSYHVQMVLNGQRKFETAAQAISRMILEKKVEKKNHAGRTVYDFKFFREGKRHIVGWYDEINDFVHFVKDAAEGGSAAELAFVLVGEPGNGKTFFVEYICEKYRRFLARPENLKYTFRFVGLNEALGYDDKVSELPSLTFEDPMILAMNVFGGTDESKAMLSKGGFSDKDIEAMHERCYRPLGASTEYLWYELMARFGDNIDKCLEHVRIVPVPMRESLGVVTGKYSAKDKITASAADLLGEESLQLMLLLPIGDPNKYDLQLGALARVGGSGLHFADEIYKNKIDFNYVYLQVIQN